MPHAAVEAIRRSDAPSFANPDEPLVRRICTELFVTRRVSDASFADAALTLGEQGLVEIIAIVGRYTLIGNIMNAFAVAVRRKKLHPSRK